MQDDLIIDVGVHRGEDTEFYLEKGFRVVGIEAYPPLYEAAQSRLRRYIDGGRLTLLNVAVSPTTSPVIFYANLDVSQFGTTSRDWARRNERWGTRSIEITVPGRRFEEILGEFGIPYYLKVDIEGADLLCVKALKPYRNKPRFISLESTKTSWDELLGEFALLRELGYDRFKVVQQQDVPLQTCPCPAREGRYVPHRFEEGATGLFGEEAPGEWLDEAEALKIYRRVFWYYRKFGDGGSMKKCRVGRAFMRLLGPRVGWYDTHAARQKS